MKTTIIIFSKNRTLQLKSLLLSLRANSDIADSQIRVIYKCDLPEISYAPLKLEFNDTTFIEQKEFLADLKKIVEGAGSDYFIFMVDDLIARDGFSLVAMERFLDDHAEVDSFSLRMGKNIQCGRTPVFIEYGDDIIAWDTSPKWGRHWNYAWEVSSSMYRKELVDAYLRKCRPDRESFPNPFEDHFYQCMPNTKQSTVLVKMVNGVRFAFARKSMRIAAFNESKCFTQGVNLVANINDDRAQQFDTVSLHLKMLDGYVVEFKSLQSVLPSQPNAGHEHFKLVQQ